MNVGGIVTKIDETGRVLIPIKIRKRMGLTPGLLELHMDGDSIVLKKFENSCALCGEEDMLTEYNGKYLCSSCIGRIKNI